MTARQKKIFYILSAGGAFFGSLALARSFIMGTKYPGNEELYGKTVVITGANRGIGKETASDLAKRGAHVIMACKDMKRCEKAREEIITKTFNKRVECVKCDLASLESIRQFVEHINKNEKFVHILVNNAGVMWTDEKSFTKDGFEKQLGINHLGHFYLTNLLLPKMIFSAPSRIVNLTSRDYLKGKINFEDLNSSQNYNREDAYNQSKLANVLFTHELNKLVRDENVTVNCVDPGYAYTDLMRNASVYKSPYSPISFFFKLFLKNAEMAAQQVIYVCVSSRYEKESGKYIRDFNEIEISKEGTDDLAAKKLWLVSKKWTRLD